MNRQQAAIAALGVLILALASLLTYLLVPRPPVGRASQVATKSLPEDSPPAPKARTTPAPPSSAELRRWIAGGWAEVRGGCGTDTGLFFSRNGRYGIFGQQGSFTIENSRLVTRLTRQESDEFEEGSSEWVPIAPPITENVPLSRDGPNRMTLTLDGRRVRYMRCPQANYEFIADQ